MYFIGELTVNIFFVSFGNGLIKIGVAINADACVMTVFHGSCAIKVTRPTHQKSKKVSKHRISQQGRLRGKPDAVNWKFPWMLLKNEGKYQTKDQAR